MSLLEELREAVVEGQAEIAVAKVSQGLEEGANSFQSRTGADPKQNHVGVFQGDGGLRSRREFCAGAPPILAVPGRAAIARLCQRGLEMLRSTPRAGVGCPWIATAP